MRKLIILILFICVKGVSQNTLNNETIFILFKKENQFNSKKIIAKSKKQKRKVHYRYHYKYKNYYDIILSFKEYKNFNEKELGNPLPYFKVNKSFLRKNKKIIYDNKKLKKLSYNKITKLFNNAKHIFLIDKEETYNNKITIKEVIYFTPNQVE